MSDHPRARQPILTLATVTVVALVAAVQIADDTVLAQWRRRPGAVAEGEWWRIPGSLLVQAGGWRWMAAVIVGLLIVGPPAERALGAVGTGSVLVGGGLVGALVGQAWDPNGAGSSVALAALVAGLATASALTTPALTTPAVAPPAVTVEAPSTPSAGLLFGLYLTSALAGHAVAGVVGAIFVAVAISAGVALTSESRGRPTPQRTVRLAAGSVIASAVMLTITQDEHGPAMLLAVAVAVAVARARLVLAGRGARTWRAGGHAVS